MADEPPAAPPGRPGGAGSPAAGGPDAPVPLRLARLRTVARLMDEAVEVPGLGVRVGLDAVLGLLPGAGDVAGAAISGWTVVAAARLGAPASLVARMLLNIAVDALLGTVPVLGDLFDVAWKANTRNLRLVEEHVLDPDRTRRRSRGVVWGAAAGVLGLLGLLVAVLAWIATGVWGMLPG